MAKRKYYRTTYQKKRKRGYSVLKFLLICFLFLIFSLVFFFIYYAKDLPRPEKFSERVLFQSTKIYDRSGEVLLYEIYGEEKRTWVSLETIPEYLKQAVICTEDANFYQHFGVDLKGIVRAILINLKIRKPTYGGSTIPQQLIRSTFLSTQKTAERKTQEIILALELDRRYSKNQILEWYLNQVPFGQNTYGVEAASQTYFKKSVSEISVVEAATLAALIKAPYRLSPYFEESKNELLVRKDYVLNRMFKEGYLNQEEVEEAKEEDLKFAEKQIEIKAPYFTLWVKQYLEEKYGEDFLRERGLKVYTSLDWELQKIAEEVVKNGVERNKIYNAHNAGLVAINPKTGEILSMTIGTGDYYAPSYPKECISGKTCLFDPKFNVVVGTKENPGRQPGSAFKPFVYTQALLKGFTPETILWDVKTEFNPNCSYDASQEKDQYGLDCYHPENYDGRFRGPISFREALAQSINLPSVKVLYLAGLNNAIELAKNLGITTLNGDYGLSLVLGGGEVKLLDMVSAYGVFAQDGKKTPLSSILKIEDSQGNIIEEKNFTPKRILPSQIVRLINDILSDNEARSPMFGPRSLLYFENYQVAAKTGTTQNFRDAWTIGYTPSVVTGVWVGNNDNSPIFKKPGVTLAGPIFHQFMEEVLTYFPKENFKKPEEILVEKPILKGEVDLENPHSILHYLDKKNPLGPVPENPGEDPKYQAWEEGIKNWLESW